MGLTYNNVKYSIKIVVCQFLTDIPYKQPAKKTNKKTLQFLLPFKYKLVVYMGFSPIFILYNIKMTKTMTINGTDYEVKKFTIPCGLCSFWSLYDRPSETKVEIYEERERVLNNIYGCTGSKFAFTIYWNVKDEKTGQLYDVRISKDHNYLM